MRKELLIASEYGLDWTWTRRHILVIQIGLTTAIFVKDVGIITALLVIKSKQTLGRSLA